MSSAAAPISGPLMPYVDGFAAVLAAQGYAAGTVMLHRQHVGHLSRWLETRALGADVLSEGLIEEFLVEPHATGRQTRLRVTAPALFGSVRFDHGLLDAVDGEDVGAVVQVAPGVGDVRSSGHAERVEGQVAAAGHSAWGGTGPQLGIVLMEGHVPGPMQV